ncbi:MFS transporter [Streptomyces tateyamensis]|uniref:MFS transporter n=1 Tax=Streptomyces tateyamensis TaxID=565073 RepID=A0A2V4N8U5_9ACTN|nr:MFS transporter [Streptomyces tateyamensis]PYC68707.1 MFS transporter [Streptomyces tateyamensis]
MVPIGSQLPRALAFWLVAAVLALLLFASGAPSPLYVTYQQAWHFSPLALTAVYAANALSLLVTLLFVGSLSDHLGRRPVLLAAVLVELGSMLLFAEARGLAWLFAGRIVQGVATGAATGALSAALIDLQPAGSRLGALVTNAASAGGLAVGALCAGLLVAYGPAPTRLVFWLLVTAFDAALPLLAVLPETVRPDGGWRRTLRPELAVPPAVRGAFTALLPSVVASWALAGLYLSLGGSLVRSVLHLHSLLAGGLVIVALQGTSAVVAVAARDWSVRRSLLVGPVALILGVALAMPALRTGSAALFFLGSAVAGVGFGPSFSGALRTLTALAPADRRAEVVTAVYVASYLALSLPAVAAGLAVSHVGLTTTATWYGAAVCVLEAVALLGTLRRREAAATGAAASPAPAQAEPALPVTGPGCAAPCPRTLAAQSH